MSCICRGCYNTVLKPTPDPTNFQSLAMAIHQTSMACWIYNDSEWQMQGRRWRDHEKQRTQAWDFPLSTEAAWDSRTFKHTHVNVCTRASIDPVSVERVVLSERGHRQCTRAHTAEIRSADDQLRSDRMQSRSRCAWNAGDDNSAFHRALVLFSSGSSSRSPGMGSDNYPLPALVQIRVLPN